MKEKVMDFRKIIEGDASGAERKEAQRRNKDALLLKQRYGITEKSLRSSGFELMPGVLEISSENKSVLYALTWKKNPEQSLYEIQDLVALRPAHNLTEESTLSLNITSESWDPHAYQLFIEVSIGAGENVHPMKLKCKSGYDGSVHHERTFHNGDDQIYLKQRTIWGHLYGFAEADNWKANFVDATRIVAEKIREHIKWK